VTDAGGKLLGRAVGVEKRYGEIVAVRPATVEFRGGVIVLVTLGVAVVALAVAGPVAWRHLQTILAGDWGNLVMLVSAVVDILALCLIAPLLMTTLALRGGIVSWPWGLVTASLFCWLLYDVAAGLRGSLFPGFPLTDVFRGLAENYLFAAGLAQRFVVRRVKKDALDQTTVGMRSPVRPPTA
jgi:hypothetical protein